LLHDESNWVVASHDVHLDASHRHPSVETFDYLHLLKFLLNWVVKKFFLEIILLLFDLALVFSQSFSHTELMIKIFHSFVVVGLLNVSLSNLFLDHAFDVCTFTTKIICRPIDFLLEVSLVVIKVSCIASKNLLS